MSNFSRLKEIFEAHAANENMPVEVDEHTFERDDLVRGYWVDGYLGNEYVEDVMFLTDQQIIAHLDDDEIESVL